MTAGVVVTLELACCFESQWTCCTSPFEFRIEGERGCGPAFPGLSCALNVPKCMHLSRCTLLLQATECRRCACALPCQPVLAGPAEVSRARSLQESVPHPWSRQRSFLRVVHRRGMLPPAAGSSSFPQPHQQSPLGLVRWCHVHARWCIIRKVGRGGCWGMGFMLKRGSLCC